VYDNTGYNYSGISDPTGTNGNISAEPFFIRNASPGADGTWGTMDDDYGDLRLRPTSPCIDAATMRVFRPTPPTWTATGTGPSQFRSTWRRRSFLR